MDVLPSSSISAVIDDWLVVATEEGRKISSAPMSMFLTFSIISRTSSDWVMAIPIVRDESSEALTTSDSMSL